MLRFTPSFLQQIQELEAQNLPFLQEKTPGALGIEDSYVFGPGWWQLACSARIGGRREQAAAYFGTASAFFWPYDDPQFERTLVLYNQTSGELQCRAAIAAALAGNSERAQQLFAWAAASCAQLPPDYEQWRPQTRGYQSAFWRIMLFWAYAEARLGRWQRVAERAHLASLGLEQDRRRKGFPWFEEIGLAYVLQALGEWSLQPAPALQAGAQARLSELFNRWCRWPEHRLRAAGFAWDLQAAFPAVLEPLVPG